MAQRVKDLKGWNKHTVFDSMDDTYPKNWQAGTLQRIFLPKLSTEIFDPVSLQYKINGGRGLQAEFEGATLLADGTGGRFIVTLQQHAEQGALISLLSSYEEPFGRFRRPSLSAYYGSFSSIESLLGCVSKGIKAAKREGRPVFQEAPIMAKMFGG